MEQEKRVREVFDDWATSGRADRMAESHTHAARPAFDRLDLAAGDSYLDIGCGNGYTVRWAAPMCRRAVGIDLSPNMIARAVDLSARIDNIEFVQSPFPDQVFEPASFDAIFSMEVLYYLTELDHGLQRVRQLLRPGGRFACVVDFYAENTASHSWPGDLGVAMVLRSERGWRMSFERAGFDVIAQERLRQPRETASEEWKATQGSLLTLGRAR